MPHWTTYPGSKLQVDKLEISKTVSLFGKNMKESFYEHPHFTQSGVYPSQTTVTLPPDALPEASRHFARFPLGTLGGKAPAAQMTIFYNGNVVVLDDVGADTANEIMRIATHGSHNIHSTRAAPLRHSIALHPIACDLPQARRASLQRFLEKRKDRICSRAPYPAINDTVEKDWLELFL